MENIPVVYEDELLLVVNKPAGLVVNRSQTTKSSTLQDFLDKDDDSIGDADITVPADEFTSRSGIVHRLDKDTSGLLLIAKNVDTFASLQKQFKDREVLKEYDALCFGAIADDTFEINAPIGRNPHLRFKFAIVEGGKEALTKFKRITTKKFETFSVTHLKCLPKTGRTHQIRVHLLAINHPIVGDVIYSTKKQLDEVRGRFARMMLHATSLEFTHPQTGKRLKLSADLPPEFNLLADG